MKSRPNRRVQMTPPRSGRRLANQAPEGPVDFWARPARKAPPISSQLVFVRILLTGRLGRVGAQPRGPRLVSTCRAAAGDMFRRLGAPGLTGAVKPPKTVLQRVALQIASAARSPYWSRSGEPHRI